MVGIETIEMLLSNDFATVRLSIHPDPDRPRLHIRDPKGGSEITLDLLEVEALTRMRHADFGPLITDTMPDGG